MANLLLNFFPLELEIIGDIIPLGQSLQVEIHLISKVLVGYTNNKNVCIGHQCDRLNCSILKRWNMKIHAYLTKIRGLYWPLDDWSKPLCVTDIQTSNYKESEHWSVLTH